MQLYTLPYQISNQLFAQAYGEGTYDSSTYSNGQTTQTGGSTAGTSGGGLTNTGIAIASILTLACLIILAALVVKVWRRPSRKVVPEEAAVEAGAPVETDSAETK